MLTQQRIFIDQDGLGSRLSQPGQVELRLECSISLPDSEAPFFLKGHKTKREGGLGNRTPDLSDPNGESYH
jgi:hypothetical protein